jgi:HK97 gp10 family phage protein
MAIIVTGVRETIAALARRQIAAEIAKPVAARSGAQFIAATMKANAPRRTGQLADSITVSMDGDDALIGAEVPYDRFVQLGTVYMEPQAYGEESARQAVAPAVAAMTAVFRTATR